MFQSLSHKILLVVAVCASITLMGFFALYWLTLEQNRSLQQHLDLPAVSTKWVTLNNAIHRATRAQIAWLESTDEKFLKERDLTWINAIHPAFEQLGLLYKKSRIWEGERSVERRAFYDLRLMILTLENLQKKTNDFEKWISPKKLDFGKLILGSRWGHCWIILGSCLDHPGIICGSSWDHLGIIFG